MAQQHSSVNDSADRFKEAAVVVSHEAVGIAYHYGYNTVPPAIDDYDPSAPDYHKDSAVWANTRAPHLRATAGLADAGHGTYQVDRLVALVDAPDDRPMEADLIDASVVFDSLVDAYDRGRRDALNDTAPDVPDPAEVGL